MKINVSGILNKIRYRKLRYKFKCFYDGVKIFYLKWRLNIPRLKFSILSKSKTYSL